jgi:hypothetical protein
MLLQFQPLQTPQHHQPRQSLGSSSPTAYLPRNEAYAEQLPNQSQQQPPRPRESTGAFTPPASTTHQIFPDFDLIDEALPHDLEAAHEDLVKAIIEEEEEEEQLSVAHRRNMEQRMDMIRIEMGLLNDLDRGGATEQYAIQLNEICCQNRKLCDDLQCVLSQFIGHLKEEDVLSLAIAPGSHGH